MTTIFNFGGGKETTAICLLIKEGIIPRPDHIIMADTIREMPTTWQYADEYIRPLLAGIGMELHVAPHSLATVDLYGKNGDLLLPVYTPTGKLSTFCSGEWKSAVVNRYARQVLGAALPFVNWIGFAFDERKRVKKQEGRWFPLIEHMITKQDCESIILAAGLPLPKKSRCHICPHQTNAEWREVRDIPELWRDAIAIDNEVREADERDGVYLHQQRVPLEQADIDKDDEREPTRQCGLGMCFI